MTYFRNPALSGRYECGPSAPVASYRIFSENQTEWYFASVRYPRQPWDANDSTQPAGWHVVPVADGGKEMRDRAIERTNGRFVATLQSTPERRAAFEAAFRPALDACLAAAPKLP
jgi:hypothetical protein